MNTPEIVWEGFSDDLTAKVGDYILRVEKLKEKHWWCCLYFKNRVITANYSRTKKEAKESVEKYYRNHSNANTNQDNTQL